MNDPSKPDGTEQEVTPPETDQNRLEERKRVIAKLLDIATDHEITPDQRGMAAEQAVTLISDLTTRQKARLTW